MYFGNFSLNTHRKDKRTDITVKPPIVKVSEAKMSKK
jgi:hypothetical protein